MLLPSLSQRCLAHCCHSTVKYTAVTLLVTTTDITLVAIVTVDLPQVVLSQEEKETEHKALGGAREAPDQASKRERSDRMCEGL